MVIEVLPSVLAEVISVTPAMWPNCRSSGVATEDAMIWALPPGKPALTEIVGKSTSGSGETGSTSNATAPASAIATVSSVVATGRWMNGAEMFMRGLGLLHWACLEVAGWALRRQKFPALAICWKNAAPDYRRKCR